MKYLYYSLKLMSNKCQYFLSVRYSHNTNELLLMKKLNIISYTSVQYRNSIISKIERLITISGGYIDDFNFFSDLSVSLRILDIHQPQTLKQFYEQLKSDIKYLQLDDQTIKVLDNCCLSVDRYSLLIFFQILFIDAKGDLRQNVPPVNN